MKVESSDIQLTGILFLLSLYSYDYLGQCTSYWYNSSFPCGNTLHDILAMVSWWPEWITQCLDFALGHFACLVNGVLTNVRLNM